ncbi:hypothetical protein B0H14DRAFT_3469781 [Mycena olivaceomarginata]|nr:hypothetical protein B0H14DRAFT_3469781 [Mycena olivaceomarginata]
MLPLKSRGLLPGAPGRSRRRSRTPPIFGPAAARYSSGRCSHTAPLLAHLTTDYTRPTDPAAARLRLHTASPRAPRRRSIVSTIGCIPSACAPPLPLLEHLCGARTPLPLSRTPAARALRGCTHTSPPLVPTSPLLLSGCVPRRRFMRIRPLLMHPAPLPAHPAPLLLSAECVPCRRSIARRRCMCTLPQPVRPAAARAPAPCLSLRCPSCTPPLPACRMCSSLITYPTATRTPSMPLSGPDILRC